MGSPADRIVVRRMLHTIHAVRDVHAARKLYQDVFGAIAFAERYHAQEDRDMALLYAADHMIEPMAPRRPDDHDTTFSRYLAKFGEGFHSFELRIDDAVAAAKLCQERGLELSTVYPTFFFVRPPGTGGVLVELCGKPLENDPKDNRGWRDDWILGHPSSLARLDHIACIVQDLDAARRFFFDVLDGELLSDERSALPQPCRRVLLRLGDTRITLIAADEPTEGLIGDYFSRPASGVYALVWQVENLDTARDYFRSRDLKLIEPALADEGFAIDPNSMSGARHEFVAVR